MQRKSKVVFGMEQPRFHYRPNGVSMVCQIQMECSQEFGHETHLVIPRYPDAMAEKNNILLPSRLVSKGYKFYITDPLQYLRIHAQLFRYCLEIVLKTYIRDQDRIIFKNPQLPL